MTFSETNRFVFLRVRRREIPSGRRRHRSEGREDEVLLDAVRHESFVGAADRNRRGCSRAVISNLSHLEDHSAHLSGRLHRQRYLPPGSDVPPAAAQSIRSRTLA
jgi:hypothetical protein